MEFIEKEFWFYGLIMIIEGGPFLAWSLFSGDVWCTMIASFYVAGCFSIIVRDCIGMIKNEKIKSERRKQNG